MAVAVAVAVVALVALVVSYWGVPKPQTLDLEPPTPAPQPLHRHPGLEASSLSQGPIERNIMNTRNPKPKLPKPQTVNQKRFRKEVPPCQEIFEIAASSRQSTSLCTKILGSGVSRLGLAATSCLGFRV